MNATEGADPFGTARLRRGVLDAWGAGPARFREDANAEEDLALGGYRDRLVVELAQNAADAAARAGVPGRLRLTLHAASGDGPAVLAAANSGAPLDATGVESLSTLRASAKREGHESAVGRFGVGFAAVLAVSDEPAVIGRHGGVRWSLAEARDLARQASVGSPGLGDELRRRDGHVPLLRLPLPAEGTAPDGYDTVVVLPLRDGVAEDLVGRLLDGVDDALLLTLPGLDEVVIETPDGVRTLRRSQQGPYTHVDDSVRGLHRWRTAAGNGPLEPALLADRPVEERLRPHWSVTWAVPVDEDGAPLHPRTAPVVHAPTPTDEPLGVPALLIASLPLDTTRRHPAPGPLTDFLVERAADSYAELLAAWEPVSVATIALVPGALGKGQLDGALRAAILERLPRVAFLEPAAPRDPAEAAGQWDDWDGAGVPGRDTTALRPVEAEVVEGVGAETVRVLAEVLPCLLPAGLERRAELRTLGVARVPLTEAVDRLAGLERDPEWWRRLYDSLAGVDPDRLSGLPVPLAGSADAPRTTIGPRQVLLPLPDEPASPVLGKLARLGLKVAHPDAAHPLLEKLGALPATPRAVLTTPQVRAAVAGSLDAGEIWDEDALDADELAETVLTLVRDADLAPGDEPWLGALALPDEDGEPAPAGELVLPDSPFAQVMREGELALCDAELAERWGEQPLTACGVLATFALVRATDVVLDPDELEPRDSDFAEPDDAGLLDAVDVWCEDVLDQLPDTPVPPVATELVAVRDLDLVDDDAWPQALAMLARPPLRDALTQPVRVLLPDGTTQSVRPYTAWWLRDHPVLDGRRPAGLRAAGGDPRLEGLYDSADATGFDDAQVLRALGVRTSVAALLDEPGGAAELLGRLADEERPVGPVQLHSLYTALAEMDPEQVTLPDELRAVVDDEVRVADAADVVIADAPDLLPLTGGLPLLPVAPARAAELADLLQVRRLGESVEAVVTTRGEEHRVPDSVRILLGAGTPDTYIEHGELRAGGVELDWRRTPDGVVHASTLEGVAAGLAWAAGQWPRRFEVAALLEDPSRTEELARDRWFD
ncbi:MULTISPECIES: sacsin N-terminal ATP-binding-like domain-containing protein [Streptomyces]|uniref:Molecular chaperone Hsp90 n=1 Tax=Streptomyces glycanivorans TaxID=3033808 RepID=A0ABY9JB74_9ACTN|nr:MULTISPECIES: molecular chaperone Hsp90 [unclassified Streptomyces]WLQ64920.1 molecular chaperone Hsp90 [Streptomyces sp. Alt3]WSQ78304.1 molecular chaperone Hsp90 [Streptomyces sp. NBC_01213]WSQ85676.1 molecular chaperone Hsp90 [Streptomyces sp. NBC_01212]WSR08231.1 molecular chaperone Hsp90 [Streptomyces sp. NBC_01208]